jgi:hypothetical protein
MHLGTFSVTGSSACSWRGGKGRLTKRRVGEEEGGRVDKKEKEEMRRRSGGEGGGGRSWRKSGGGGWSWRKSGGRRPELEEEGLEEDAGVVG